MDPPPDDDPPERPPPAPVGLDPPADLVTVEIVRVDPDAGIALPDPRVRLDYGRDRRTFPRKLAAYLKLKWRRCAMPGCNVPLDRLDIDHPEQWAAGGQTNQHNAIPACPHHNRTTRNRPGWSIEVNPEGIATLTTPMGRRYPITPHNYLR
jgi:hypothetical protein